MLAPECSADKRHGHRLCSTPKPPGDVSQPQPTPVVFDLDAASFSSDEFRMYAFKVCQRI